MAKAKSKATQHKAMRPTWEGHLRLSLVTCPVALYTATERTADVHFNMINPKTNNRIHMQTVDAGTGDVLERGDLVRGFEVSKNKYVLFDKDELDAVKLESTRIIDIEKFVPRASIVYDVFGTGRTAIKVAYGRYMYNAGTMTNANSMMAGFVNPMAKTTKRYRWDGTLPFVPDPSRLISTTGGPNRSLDPNLELPYTDEFVAGIDQQVMRDMTVRFNYVRKLERNRMKLQNTAIPFSAYNIPLVFLDRGRDFASAADDRQITLFSLDPKFLGQRADLLTNDPLNKSDFATYNIEAVKRLSRKFQLLTGFDVSHYDTWAFAQAIAQDIATDTGGVPQDPNRLTYNNRLDYWHWQYKALGSYELPYGVGFSASVRVTKG